MADTNKESKPHPKGRWLKRLTWCGAGLLVALVVLYFMATSSAFFKRILLPRLGSALNANISVSDAEISPFSHIVLHDLKVTPKGGEPVFTATSVTARYDLLSILRGHILVDEASVVGPTVTVIENADGTSNLDPLLKSEKLKGEQKPASAPSAKPSEPPAIDV